MYSSKAYIRDRNSLVELNNSLEYTADSILKILESVDSYLSGVRDVLNRQLEILGKELEDAEQELSDAESEWNDCLASQEWDEDSETYRPSCSTEEGRVSKAREYRDICREKYDAGCKIVDEFNGEYGKYKEPGGFVTPPGGEKTLENLAREHTDAAVDKMHGILEIVDKYLRLPMHIGSGSRLPFRPSSGGRQNEPIYNAPLVAEVKGERYKNAIQRVIAMQKERNSGDDKIADANRVMICPDCKRPTAACICVNKREHMRIICHNDNTR